MDGKAVNGAGGEAFGNLNHDTRLPDDNCNLASHAGPDWSFCRSVSLYEVQGAGCFPYHSVHAGGCYCMAV